MEAVVVVVDGLTFVYVWEALCQPLRRLVSGGGQTDIGDICPRLLHAWVGDEKISHKSQDSTSLSVTAP